MKGLVKTSYTVGEFLLTLIKLQFYWIVFTLKGGIILGIFPATALVIDYYLQSFNHTPFTLSYQSLNQKWRAYLKETNILGYLMTGVLAVLYLDLRISQHFIGSTFLHFFLIFLLCLAFGTFLYVLPSYLRYDMPTLQHIKQAFFLLIANILDVVAMLLGVMIVTGVFVLLPILSIVGFMPLLALPVAWFSLISMKKIETQQTPSSGDV